MEYSNSTSSPLSLGTLHITIAENFSHNPSEQGTPSLELAKTVYEKLLQDTTPLTSATIAQMVYKTLKAYDPIAAFQYGAKHRIVTSTRRRRGRPSTRSAS